MIFLHQYNDYEFLRFHYRGKAAQKAYTDSFDQILGTDLSYKLYRKDFRDIVLHTWCRF